MIAQPFADVLFCLRTPFAQASEKTSMRTVKVTKAQYLKAIGGRGRNKYGAKKTTVDGRTYDSRAEAEASVTLALAQRRGEIAVLEYQPVFELLPRPNRIKYVADFRVVWTNGIEEIIDVKGVETDGFKLKKKMFRHFFPEKRLRIVKKGDNLLPPCVGM